MPFTPGSIANKYTNTGATNKSGFVPGSVSSKFTNTSSSSSSFTPGSVAGKYPSVAKDDLSTIEGLQAYAKKVGLGDKADEIVNPTPKLSFLQRLGKGLGAFNPAEAILTGQEKGIGAGLLEYPKRIVQGIGSAITGVDYGGNQRTFKDVVEKEGIENGIAKFGLGFVGDVLLDPTTYFGGTIAKGLVKGAGAVTKTGINTLAKVAPETAQGLKTAGTGLSDAFGSAFKFGYKSQKGATSDIATFLSKEQQAKLGLASSNLARLGTGVLTKSQQEELALKLVAGKRAEFTAREAGTIAPAVTSTDPLIQKTIEEQSKRSAKFASQLDLQNPYETYFPFIKKDKLDDFIKKTSSSSLRVGSEGYKKEFKNLLTNDALELDPAKAFFTSEAQQVTDRMTRDFLGGFVSKYGKGLNEFKSVDEARALGYEIIKEKGIFGKELGYLPKWDAKLIRDSLDPGFQTINMLAKATGFDAVTSLFKRSVTGIFAPFHVRNYMSGHIQNFEVLGIDALNPKNINAGQKVAFLMGKGKKLPKELEKTFKPFIDRFSGDTFYNADFENALKSGNDLKTIGATLSKERLKTTIKTLGLGQEAIPFKVGRAVGQFIEHSQKATAYITALSQGKTVQEALDLATKAGFDYRQLTAFESQIMRRIVPFYSFARKNIALQLQTLGENPQRINQILAFFGNNPLALFGLKEGTPLTDEEKKNLPSFLREAIGIKLEDTPEGLSQFISSFGTPIEAFAQLFGSNPVLRGISMMNPIIKAPIEIGIGKDSFRQRDLKDVYDAKEYELAPQVVKDLLDITPVKRDIFKKGGDGKLHKVGSKIQYVADPVKLLIARSLFTSRGVSYLDQVFNGDTQGLVKFIKTTTGFKAQTQDLQMNKSINETNKKRELEDLLTKRSDIRKYDKVYKPK